MSVCLQLAFPIELPPSLTAEGPQTTGPLSYHISGGNAQVHFRIDSTTGSLFFTGNDDFDDPSVNSTLTLDITVSDLSGRNRKVKVEVKVVDVNDNAPEVTSDIVTLLVSKTSLVGTVIGHIEARDRDRGENGRLNYEIVASTVPQSTFRVRVCLSSHLGTLAGSVVADAKCLNCVVHFVIHTRAGIFFLVGSAS